MNNRKKILRLLTQVRDQLQINQGMTANQFDEAIIKLNQAITEIEAGSITSPQGLLFILGQAFKFLPSIIDILNKYLGG